MAHYDYDRGYGYDGGGGDLGGYDSPPLRPDLMVSMPAGCGALPMCLEQTMQDLRGVRHSHGLYSDHCLPVQHMPPTYASTPQWGSGSFAGSGSLNGTAGALPTMPLAPCASLGPDSYHGQPMVRGPPQHGDGYGPHDDARVRAAHPWEPHCGGGLPPQHGQLGGHPFPPSAAQFSVPHLPQQQSRGQQLHRGMQQHLAPNPEHDLHFPAAPLGTFGVHSSLASGTGPAVGSSAGFSVRPPSMGFANRMGYGPLPQGVGPPAQCGGSFDRAAQPDTKIAGARAVASTPPHPGVGPPPPRDFTNQFKDSSSYLASPAVTDRPKDYEPDSESDSGGEASQLGTDRFNPPPQRRVRSSSKQDSSCIRCVMPCLVTC